MFRKTCASVIMLVVSLVVIPADAGTLEVTLYGPTAAQTNVTISYTGSVKLLAAGAPAQDVALLVDGAAATGTKTGSDGWYTIQHSFSTAGTFTLEAVVHRGTALESRSPGLVVAVALKTPTLTSSTPVSPANNNFPVLKGTKAFGSVVSIYTTASCSGAAVGNTGAATGTSFSVDVTVSDDTTTNYYARAADTSGHTSACSAGFKYVEDSTAPAFAGLASATTISATSLRLAWVAATDAITPSASIVYEVCRSTSYTGCTTFIATQTTAPGITGIDVMNLVQNTRYYFVVRARDAAGNRDTNSVKQSAKTLGTAVVTSVATGHDYSCALISDGTVRCWGLNDQGQLGNGTTTNSIAPVTVSGLTDAVAITTAYGHACAVVSSGRARCWGDNASRQLGNGTTTDSSSPVTVSGLTETIAITAGAEHTCALRSDGTGRCWGSNGRGQLGDATTTNRSTPVVVSGLSNAKSIAAGYRHTCALLSTGISRCWGESYANGAPTDRTTPGSVDVANVVAITAGNGHTCALRTDGTARCWGLNDDGQLGNDEAWPFFQDSIAPVVVYGLTDAVAISAGDGHTCALRSDGTARCWGVNFGGELGDGTSGQGSGRPVVVSGLTNATGISAGYGHTCAVRSDGTARCWGSNISGQLGNGTTSTSATTTPVSVGGLLAIVGGTQIDSGSDHVCALLSDGTARCWGGNSRGQLGNGTTTDSAVPVTVTGLTEAISITAGVAFTCALRSNGSVRCWGDNIEGQLGNGTTTNSSVPVTVTGLSNAIAISAGAGHVCALRSDGTARCWGAGYQGRLGNGTTTNSSTPVTVTGLASAHAITAGYYHSCALIADGTARCWGSNADGQLGNGTQTDSSIPVVVSRDFLTDAVAISGGGGPGEGYTCALRADGTARCWGNNAQGQLGDGTTMMRTTPVVVSGLLNATSITTASRHTCAGRSDGTVRCWGGNLGGTLGNGTTTRSSTPVTVTGLANAVVVTADGSHSCALLSGGAATCWGGNGGVLGTGSTAIYSTTPVAIQHFP